MTASGLYVLNDNKGPFNFSGFGFLWIRYSQRQFEMKVRVYVGHINADHDSAFPPFCFHWFHCVHFWVFCSTSSFFLKAFFLPAEGHYSILPIFLSATAYKLHIRSNIIRITCNPRVCFCFKTSAFLIFNHKSLSNFIRKWISLYINTCRNVPVWPTLSVLDVCVFFKWANQRLAFCCVTGLFLSPESWHLFKLSTFSYFIYLKVYSSSLERVSLQ